MTRPAAESCVGGRAVVHGGILFPGRAGSRRGPAGRVPLAGAARYLRAMDDGSFRALVDDTLARDLDETLFYGQYVRVTRAEEPFDTYARRVRAEVDRQFAQRVATIDTPPPPHLLTIKSWQHGFTGAATRSEAERARDGALYLRLQAWRNERLTTGEWRRCLDAFDRPDRWLALARAHEDEGQIVRANAALAAARWLDPEGTREAAEAMVAARPAGLPARLAAQPDPTWRTLRFGDRHWRAWDMKNYALLDLPSLLAGTTDENFSVRTRVYRSLGQRPHPASIQCLREGTRDPHFFARAQAARSLGWCVDPTAHGFLADLARDDPHPEVRRTAEKARQRIVGYWRHFGDWGRLWETPEALRFVARALAADGLVEAALDLFAVNGNEEADELDTRSDEERFAPTCRYGYWFAEAEREEAALAAAADTDRDLAATIAGDDEAACLRALAVVSRHRRAELRPEVEARRADAGAIGWSARRAMRSLGWTALVGPSP